MNTNVLTPSFKLLVLPVTMLCLSGCAKEEESVAAEPVRPVKTIVVEQPEQGGVRNFPARIDALKKAELSFRLPGKISELPIKEGDPVERGQVLAKLDPTDFQIVLNDRQATYDQAKNDYERAKELVKDGFISRTDFDKKEADFKNAVAALDQARQDMLYTELDAPFAGTVAKRYVQRFEEVQAKEPVLALHDNSALEVKIDVPETLILKIDPGREGADDRVPVTASFDSIPGRRFDVAFKEVATRADAKTQTFEVTFTMPAPPELTVLPGMTATATADLRRVVGTDQIFFLPVTAVTGDSGLEPFVWVVDETGMTVEKRSVDIGKMVADRIEVRGGVEPGDRVVVAGVGYLSDGMKVRLMKQSEQAEPRPEDLPPAAKP